MKIDYIRHDQKPSEGDTKTLNSGERFVRKQDRVYDRAGKRIGMLVAHGRPRFSWVKEPSKP